MSELSGRDAAKRADEMIENYLGGRSLRFTRTEGGYAMRFATTASQQPLRVAIAVAEGGVAVSASPEEEVPRDRWHSAVWSCNVWNNQSPSPKARLTASDWTTDHTARVTLDGWLPLAEAGEVDQATVDAVADTTIRGALEFSRRLFLVSGRSTSGSGGSTSAGSEEGPYRRAGRSPTR